MNQFSMMPMANPGSPQGATQASPLNPKMLLNAARRWWKLSLFLGILFGGTAAGAAYYTYEAMFQAETWLQIEERQPYIAFRPEENRAVYLNTQQELVKSPPVLADALAKPEVASLKIVKEQSDPIKWLQSTVVAKPVGQSEVFMISMQCPQKEAVAKLVNGVRDAYLAVELNHYQKEKQETLDILEKERARRESELEDGRRHLKSMVGESAKQGKGAVTTILPPTPVSDTKDTAKPQSPLLQEVSQNTVGLLKQQLSQVEVDLVIKKAEYEVAKKVAADRQIRVTPAAIQEYVARLPEVIGLKGDIDRLEKKIVESKSNFAPGSALEAETVAPLRSQITTKQEELQRLMAAKAPQVEKALMQAGNGERLNQLEDMAGMVERLQLLQSVLEDKLTKERKEAQAAGEASVDITFMKEDLDRGQKVYDMIATRMEAIRTEDRAPSRIKILSAAVEPKNPVDSGPLKRVLLFAIPALLAPFGAFLIWELRTKPVADSQDFAQASNLQVVGEIAELPLRTTRYLPGGSRRFDESLSRFEESVDYLRTSIHLASQHQPIQSLVVCSALSREGKSTVAAHLAASLARSGNGRVILIDADLRRPRLHHLLDQPNDVGLADYLQGKCSLDEVIKDSWVEGMAFVAAGALKAAPGAVIRKEAFDKLIGELRSRFDFVVIDVPPILPVSDGLVIARCADGAILCGLRDHSRTDAIRRAKEKLELAEANVIGAVLNGVPPSTYGSASYYYYRVGATA